MWRARHVREASCLSSFLSTRLYTYYAVLYKTQAKAIDVDFKEYGLGEPKALMQTDADRNALATVCNNTLGM
jgi:hypothetical protein